MLANALDPIIETYNKKPSIQILQKKVEAQERTLKSALKKPQHVVMVQNPNYPKHILHHIFKLSALEQKMLFKHGGCENALMYALTHEPEALPEFDLDEGFKQQAILARIKPNNYSALIVAAKHGAINTIRLLLSWGSDIESHDANNSTALHWAASCGHIDVVTCLLDNGALLEARGWGNNTPLNFAVRDGRSTVIELLLKKNAHVNARNSEGNNALDIAIARHPEFIEPILMQMATLPVDQQAECLLNAPGGPYPNVFFYAVTVNTKFLKTLLCSFNNSALDSKMQHIHQIGLHYQKMIKKSSSNSNYKAAVSAAKALLETCIDEMLKVYQNNDNTDVKMLEFKKSYTGAIEIARPVLTKYREWGKVLAAFLLAVITLPISLPLYAAGFFSAKTKSEQLLDNLQSNVNKFG